MITSYSKVVLVILLVATAVIGSGATMVDDDSSLDQFESDSPEGQASEYISENFTTEDGENTTTVQVIKRGDLRGTNVLSQESLVTSLEFQQEIRANESINATLHDDSPIVGVENIVAISEIRGAEFDELEAEADALNESADELEAEADALNESADALEAEFERFNESLEALNDTADELEGRGNALERSGERLEGDAAELEADGAELAADQAELEARVGYLETALNDTAALQVQYEEAAAAGNDTERAALNQTIEGVWSDAVTNANLDPNQTATFEMAGEQVRDAVSIETRLEGLLVAQPAEITSDPAEQAILRDALEETVDLQTQYDQAGSDAERDTINQSIEQEWDGAVTAANLNQTQTFEFEAVGEEVRSTTTEQNQSPSIEDAFELGTLGVFADEFSELEERGEDLEQRGEEIEERGERISDLASDLERDADELEEEGDELEEWGEELEAWADELEERGDELEAWGDELEERGDRLEEEFEALADADDPSLAEQIDHLKGLNETAFESALTDALSDDDDNSTGALELMPTDYEPGDTEADARMMFIVQSTEGAEMDDMGGFHGDASDAQLDLRTLANEQDEEYAIFGFGVISDEIDRSMTDSLIIVGPLALLFVVVALMVAYRDPLDIVLGVAGIGAVLIWTFGFMGWAGIAFNQMFVAVPVLLIGLSIDYAIHVFMRHREQRQYAHTNSQRDGGRIFAGLSELRGSMVIALAGVGVALVWVTATTMIGFLANLISPIEPIREFGVVSAFGILSALIIFGALVPAVKVELDGLLEARGFNRRKRAFGTGESRFNELLLFGAIAARRAPVVIIVVVLLLTAGGVYGATQVDTSFDEEDFLADEPPEWTKSLPGPFSPGEYQAKADLEFVNDNFQREDSQARILIEGDVTDPSTLQRIDEAQQDAADSDVAYILASGEPDIESPLTMMDDAATQNESFNESFVAADTTGDGIPDENVEALYDELFEVDDDAATVIYRTDDGEYEAVQIVVSVRGNAAFSDVTEEMRAIATAIEGGQGSAQVVATATGDPIVSYVVEQDLLETVLESLLITLIAVFVFLSLAYWAAGKGASLGTITLLPVAFSVAWILGSMYVIGMPFNVLTGMITSLTVGLGVAYSIHISSRYTLELDRQGNVWDALETTVTGTGGALLGSAATTVGGFGTLTLAILPVLSQFGIITGLTIIYAFLASVIVLPSLLVLWTRYLGPSDVSFGASTSDSREQLAGGDSETTGDAETAGDDDD